MLLVFIIALTSAAPLLAAPPNKNVNADFYSNIKSSYSLASSEDYTYVRVQYEPTGSPGNLQRVTHMEFVDSRPVNFNNTYIGFNATGPGAKSNVYVVYSFDDDSVIFASTNKNAVILEAFQNFNLGTRQERQAAFDELKGINREDGHTVSFTPMVNISADIFLDLLKPFVTNGFLIGASVILVAFFIREKILARRKNLMKLEGRENRALAKDNGLKRKVVEKLRDDYAVLDKKVRRSMSFGDYVGLHKKEYSK